MRIQLAFTLMSMLRGQDLRDDAAILRRAYEAMRPGLYRYNTREQMNEAFRVLDQEFGRDRTLADAYLAFSIFAAKVRCGHTYPNFFNQKKEIAAALFRSGRVPFYFRWLGQRMIVTRSFAADARLLGGTEVLTINGVPAAAILERLMTVARADGHNNGKRAAYMEVQGGSRYEAFDIYWPLFFPSSDPLLKMRVRGPNGGTEAELEVRLMNYEERLAAMAKTQGAPPEGTQAAWEFRILEDGIGYFRMPAWALFNSRWDWRSFLRESFVAIAKTGTVDLVVDVRGNEGGLDVGDELTRYLITKEVPRQAVVRKVRYRKAPEDLVPYLDTWDRSFFDWGSSATELSDGLFRLRRDANDDLGAMIRPAAPRFGGRTWVLVGAENSSAAFEFAQTVRQNGLGRLVGQTTGGNQRGITGGAFFFLRLPRSGIELDLPLIAQFPEGERRDGGLDPDVLVTPATRGIASGLDEEMEAVRSEVRKARR